jgi:hypothetical protein
MRRRTVDWLERIFVREMNCLARNPSDLNSVQNAFRVLLKIIRKDRMLGGQALGQRSASPQTFPFLSLHGTREIRAPIRWLFSLPRARRGLRISRPIITLPSGSWKATKIGLSVLAGKSPEKDTRVPHSLWLGDVA